MQEHDNRKIAKKFAEYLTGDELRKYVANKVKKYLFDNPTVFDGAVGSGQLEQYVKPSKIYAVEIQKSPCMALTQNFENVDIENKSFFNYNRTDVITDCVIMNPPFSINFKDLSKEEQENIQLEFEWKKSGKVDDIFVLKSLKYTKRYGFYILFPGVSYRKTEEKFRQEIGFKLLELNVVKNAFENTSIDVLFIVIDKEKTTLELKKEIYDCKTKNIIQSQESIVEQNFEWIVPIQEIEKENINIDKVNKDLNNMLLECIKRDLEKNIMLVNVFQADIDVLGLIKDITKICIEFEKKLKSNIKEQNTKKLKKKKDVNQLSLF